MSKKESFQRNFTEPLVITANFVSGAAQVDLLEGDLICISWYQDLPPVATESSVPGQHELRLSDRTIMPRSSVSQLQSMLHEAEKLVLGGRTKIFALATH